MTIVYVIALLAGIVAFLAWIAATSIAASVDGWHTIDPERRFGTPGRLAVAGIMSFGMAGMSATYAGWSIGFALLAALLGAGFGAVTARFLGPAA